SSDLLPPAPVVPRRGRGRSLAVVGLLLVLGLAAVLMAVNLRSHDDGNPTATRGTTPAGCRAHTAERDPPGGAPDRRARDDQGAEHHGGGERAAGGVGGVHQPG